MGVVYRARDTKLNRDVALKVLPGEFARDADRLARFKREAQVLASLNHPNIAAIYRLEESPAPAFAGASADKEAGHVSSERAGGRNLFWQAADGTGTVERLSESDGTQNPSAVSPDGSRVIFQQTTAANGFDLMELHLDDGGSIESSPAQQHIARRVTPLVQTPFAELNGVVSPVGRWLAYEANDSGQFEIYVRPYPEVSRGLWQVSTGGGTRPLWARSGQELFYLSPAGALMRVAVERGPTWSAGTPTKLLNEGYFSAPGGNPRRTYDISPDGQRFLMIKAGAESGQAAAPQIVVVQNWLEELKRLLPVD